MAASDHLQDHSHPSTLHHSDVSTSSSLSATIAPQGPVFPPSLEAATTTSRGGVQVDPSSTCPLSPPTRTVKSSVKNGTTKDTKKRVSWDRIHTREFTLVVGDHPMCQDSLPVSLGWQYDDHSCSSKDMNQFVENQNPGMGEKANPGQPQPTIIRERRQSYVFPRRLSYEERKERLLSVSNLSSEQIKNEEIDLVVRKMKESWDMLHSCSESNGDDDVIMTPVQTNHDFPSLLVDDDLMELDDIEVIPGIDGQELGDITNFQWIDN